MGANAHRPPTKTPQNQSPLIPSPRTETKNQAYDSNVPISLFTTTVEPAVYADAQRFIRERLSDAESIKIGSFVTQLLEKLHAIPPEISAEDAAAREASLKVIESLMIDHEKLKKDSGDLDLEKFGKEVTGRVGRDIISEYTIIVALREALKNTRTGRRNEQAERVLNVAQQIAQIGIAKQLGVYGSN